VAKGRKAVRVSAREAAFAIWLLTHYFRAAPEWTMFTNTGNYTLLFPQGKLGSRAWKKWAEALKAAKKARFSK